MWKFYDCLHFTLIRNEWNDFDHWISLCLSSLRRLSVFECSFCALISGCENSSERSLSWLWTLNNTSAVHMTGTHGIWHMLIQFKELNWIQYLQKNFHCSIEKKKHNFFLLIFYQEKREHWPLQFSPHSINVWVTANTPQELRTKTKMKNNEQKRTMLIFMEVQYVIINITVYIFIY